jgi:GTP-binding protein LepA
MVVTNPSEFPTARSPRSEPVVKATILTPSDFVGTIMELCQARRGTLLGMDYLSEDRVEMRYTLPLAEIVFDFFDQLKSRTRGYASLDYEPTASRRRTWSRSTSCCMARPSTRSARSCTGTRRTPTG